MTKYNSVFISDLHLGSKHCQSDKLLEFIKTLETNNLFLVWDIIDGWRLSKKWYWPKEHSKIIKEILKKDKEERIKNPEKYKEKSKKQYWKHRDKLLKRNAEYRVKNVEKISAQKKIGIDDLRKIINIELFNGIYKGWISLEASLGKTRAKLFRMGCINEEKISPTGKIFAHINIGRDELNNFVGINGFALCDDKDILLEI